MSAPVLWIVIPNCRRAGLFFLRRWYRLTVALGTGLALLLALLAWQLPVNQTVILGPLSFKIGDTLNILGRQFTLLDSDRPLVLVIYLLAAIWFAAAYTGRAGRMFVPLGLVITGLLTAVPAVDPFLYAAMLVELIALVGVVMLSRPGSTRAARRPALFDLPDPGNAFHLLHRLAAHRRGSQPWRAGAGQPGRHLTGHRFCFLAGNLSIPYLAAHGG